MMLSVYYLYKHHFTVYKIHCLQPLHKKRIRYSKAIIIFCPCDAAVLSDMNLLLMT